MNPKVLRRFVILLGIATFAFFSLWMVIQMIRDDVPGDFHTRAGDILLGDGKYEEALISFDKALAEIAHHRGAVMGRAVTFIRMGKTVEANAELTYLIKTLNKTLEPDDPTGRGTLAAAYANRGILHDRAGRYKQALADYIEAIKTDREALDGPNIFDKVLYGTPRPSTVEKRAIYLYEQLALPPEKRVMRVPEIDAQQRMYKP
jgi:tetratricopeptide (TPR) repeat protein